MEGKREMAEIGLEGWKKEHEEVKKKRIRGGSVASPVALLAFSNRLRGINAETKGGWARNN